MKLQNLKFQVHRFEFRNTKIRKITKKFKRLPKTKQKGSPQPKICYCKIGPKSITMYGWKFKENKNDKKIWILCYKKINF